mgnify:CR=1 FL=1
MAKIRATWEVLENCMEILVRATIYAIVSMAAVYLLVRLTLHSPGLVASMVATVSFVIALLQMEPKEDKEVCR